jgi:hypothetical protein
MTSSKKRRHKLVLIAVAAVLLLIFAMFIWGAWVTYSTVSGHVATYDDIPPDDPWHTHLRRKVPRQAKDISYVAMIGLFEATFTLSGQDFQSWCEEHGWEPAEIRTRTPILMPLFGDLTTHAVEKGYVVRISPPRPREDAPWPKEIVYILYDRQSQMVYMSWGTATR